MESKPMKLLIIEDDIVDCNNFINCVKKRNDIEIVGITDSDIEGLKLKFMDIRKEAQSTKLTHWIHLFLLLYIYNGINYINCQYYFRNYFIMFKKLG